MKIMTQSLFASIYTPRRNKATSSHLPPVTLYDIKLTLLVPSMTEINDVHQINMVKRHLDAGAVNEFWAGLDDSMLLKAPALYQGVLAGNSAPPSKPKS